MVHIDVHVQLVTRVSGIEDNCGGHITIVEILPGKDRRYGYHSYEPEVIAMYVTTSIAQRGNANVIIRKACATYPESYWPSL